MANKSISTVSIAKSLQKMPPKGEYTHVPALRLKQRA